MQKSKKNLKETIKGINKKYGENAMATLDESDIRGKVEGISTNCYSLDRIFGCGGFPRGKIIDIYGEPSSGKSTLAMYIVGQIQKEGGNAAWIDSEMAFTTEYAESVGVNISDLLLSQPETGEQALDMVEQLVGTGEIDIIVVDSTAALVPQKELEGEVTDSNVALQARLLSKGLRMITGVASRSKTAIIFISQVRDKIGGFIGPSTDSTGGKALKFYSSVRLKVSRIKTLKDKETAAIGNTLKIEAVKNKIGLPFRKAQIDLYFKKGLDVVGDVIDSAVKKNIMVKSGMTYYYGNKKLGGSRQKTIDILENDQATLQNIKDQLIALDNEEEKPTTSAKEKAGTSHSS
jgi:recombination protein RecA